MSLRVTLTRKGILDKYDIEVSKLLSNGTFFGTLWSRITCVTKEVTKDVSPSNVPII